MKKEKIFGLLYFAKQSNLNARDGKNSGDYPFYSSSPSVSKRISSAQYEKNALIIGTGGAANVHFSSIPFSTTSHCIVLYSKNDKSVNAKYVYYFLAFNLQLLEEGFKGAGLKNLSKTHIANIEIPVLKIEEQEKIVTILDKIQSLTEKREKTIRYLEDLQYSIFIDMFGDPVINPKGWDETELKNISILERGRFSPRPRNDPSYFGGAYPFIQTGDISQSNHRISGYKQTLNEKGIGVSKKFGKNTIVIALVGATIGKTAVLEIDVYATDSIIGITADPNKINNVFLEMLLRFQKDKLSATAPKAARANINLSILEKLKIILPPVQQQNQFEKKYESILAKKKKLIESNEIINLLFKSLSQQAFSGNFAYNPNIELDAILNAVELEKPDTENNLTPLSKGSALTQLLIDRLKSQKFDNSEMYDKARYAVFRLIKDKEIIQKFDKNPEKIKLIS